MLKLRAGDAGGGGGGGWRRDCGADGRLLSERRRGGGGVRGHVPRRFRGGGGRGSLDWRRPTSSHCGSTPFEGARAQAPAERARERARRQRRRRRRRAAAAARRRPSVPGDGVLFGPGAAAAAARGDEHARRAAARAVARRALTPPHRRFRRVRLHRARSGVLHAQLRTAAIAAVGPDALLLKFSERQGGLRAADLRFLSCYPAEAEHVWPPMTHLQPTGNMEVVRLPQLGDAKFTVVEVEPRAASARHTMWFRVYLRYIKSHASVSPWPVPPAAPREVRPNGTRRGSSATNRNKPARPPPRRAQLQAASASSSKRAGIRGSGV